MSAINEKELNGAIDESVEENSHFTIALKKPVTYNGKEYKELSFDFDKLTGRDGLAIEDELSRLGKAVIAPVFSGEYLVRMAARACTEQVGADIFDMLTLTDYNRVRSEARSFLLRSE